MNKLLISLSSIILLSSCTMDDKPEVVKSPIGHSMDSIQQIDFIEIPSYFDEFGNPLDQSSINNFIELQFSKNKTYTYREARKEAIEIIKHFESFSGKRYKCPAGRITIGYGLTGKYLKGRHTISKTEAENDLKHIYDDIYSNIENELGYKLKQNQMAALVSFAFNVGENRLYNSTLFKHLKDRKIEYAELELSKFVFATNHKSGKKVKMLGLERRRQSEINLFNS